MKIKKRNLFYFIFIILTLICVFFMIQLQPLFDIQIKAHFHEKVIQEIMNSVNQIEIPENFIIQEEKNNAENNTAPQR